MPFGLCALWPACRPKEATPCVPTKKFKQFAIHTDTQALITQTKEALKMDKNKNLIRSFTFTTIFFKFTSVNQLNTLCRVKCLKWPL